MRAQHIDRPARPWWRGRLARLCAALPLSMCGVFVSAADTPAGPVQRLESLGALLGLPGALPVGSVGDAAARAPLTLVMAAQRAQEFSTEIRAAQFRLQSFEQTRNVARGALLPKLDVRLAHGVGRPLNVEAPQTLRRVDDSAVLRQALFDEPGRREWSRQELLVESAQAQFAGAQGLATLEASVAFLQVLQASIALHLSREHEALLEELLRYVTARATAGGASGAERDRIQGRVANVRGSMADTLAQRDNALRALERLTDTLPQAVSLSSPPDLRLPDSPVQALDEARIGNADLRGTRSEREAAEMERRANRARWLPTLHLELTQSRARNSGGTVNGQDDTKFMVVLNLPLFNGGSDVARERASLARREELTARTEGVERRLRQEIETAYANIAAAQRRTLALQEELEANGRVVQAFRAQLVGGNRPLLDVLDAYQRAFQTRMDLAQVTLGLLQNELRIGFLMGDLPRALMADASQLPAATTR